MFSTGDDAVVATNDDAAICKFQAVSKGYYKDAFLEYFLTARARSCGPRKASEINRGYFARTAAISYLVEQFILANPDCQIISLGAGYDTLFWRLKSHNFLHHHTSVQSKIKFVEIDMSVVTAHKVTAIRRHPQLAEALSSITHKGEGIHSDQYHMISFDLRQVDKSSLKEKIFSDCKLDSSTPTFCIAECVLVYMPYQDSASLIQWLSSSFSNLTMLNYEQCNMRDRFGDIMLSNMTARHCDLMGVEACESLKSQSERFKSNGLVNTRQWTLSEIYYHYLNIHERHTEEIELLDETELLRQLLDHYCIVIASHHPIDWIHESERWAPKTI